MRDIISSTSSVPNWVLQVIILLSRVGGGRNNQFGWTSLLELSLATQVHTISETPYTFSRSVLPETAHNPVAISPKCIAPWSYRTPHDNTGQDIVSYPVLVKLSDIVLTYPILSKPVLSCTDLPWPILTYPDLSWPILTYPDLSWPVLVSYSF